ncbi:MAG: L-glutamate gamma-semialdehyde dehydrogenase [Bacteroidia bacterium]|nr:L-glutamate gamma-semialdehyde dehydrogenase [Bacteroidia bacterium]
MNFDARLCVPLPQNEPVFDYAPKTPARKGLKAAVKQLRSRLIEIPMFIGGKEVFTEHRREIRPPHELKHVLASRAVGDETHVAAAVEAALKAKKAWENTPWHERAAVFLKAAEIISGPRRYEFNAATLLGQSKTPHQSEIDAVCELADFFRFNVAYAQHIYEQQPASPPGVWNRLDYRPLEGFVFALTPFNFTSIAGNLPCAPALMGNTVVWKPADSQIYSAWKIMEILREAGLPDGVINLVYADGPTVGKVVFGSSDFAGLHFTGSTVVFRRLWRTVGENIHLYKSYPRIVGETGGKDFVVAHPDADAQAVAVALMRGAFEFQGQKCSAASRAYLPQSLADDVLDRLVRFCKEIKPGSPEDFSNFFTAVIDERAFDKISGYIEAVKQEPSATLLCGGGYDKSEGYFIEPTVFLTSDPQSLTMREEVFGPVLTVYVYPDERWRETLELCDRTSPYALTGAVFARERAAIVEATDILRHAAGNFYINDKPTGAVVNQQPFGGGRASGTNDKAGSMLNLLRWVSPRTVKETFVPPLDWRYPFMG